MDFSASVVSHLLLVHNKLALITACASAFEFSIPLIVLMRIHLGEGFYRVAFRTAEKALQDRYRIDKDISHSGQLLTGLDHKLKEPIVLLKELLGSFYRVSIYLRG